MIASRILSILLRLQHGPATARVLAEEFEVSTRTIYRDVDQLAYAGIPVYCERGREGGIHLDKAWSNRSFGLTASEVEVLLAANDRHVLRDLGLDLPVTDAQRKLLLASSDEAATPGARRAQRILIDPIPWYRHRDCPTHLTLVAKAVWEARQIAIVYAAWKRQVRRIIDPLGIVLKAGNWYLVAACEGSTRTYRIGQIEQAQITGQPTRLPPDFNLAEYWQGSIERFERDLENQTAQILVTEEGLRRLDRLGAHVLAAAKASLGEADANGWMRASIPIETIEHATYELLSVGSHLRVTEPVELKASILTQIRSILEPV